MTTRLFVTMIANLILLTTTLMAGCGGEKKPAQPTQPKPDRIVIAFLDNSKSLGRTPEERRDAKARGLNFLYQVVRQQPEGKVGLELYEMANTTNRVYKDVPPHPRALRTMIKELSERPVEEKPGTYFAPAIDILRERLGEIKRKLGDIPVVVLFLTDGAIDDRINAKTATETLFKMSNTTPRHIEALPVNPEGATIIDANFKQFADDDRYASAGSYESAEPLSRVLAALNNSAAPAANEAF